MQYEIEMSKFYLFPLTISCHICTAQLIRTITVNNTLTLFAYSVTFQLLLSSALSYQVFELCNAIVEPRLFDIQLPKL